MRRPPKGRRPVRLWVVTLAALAAASRPAHAQRTLGVGEDAFVLPAGTVRIGIAADGSRYNQRYGGGTADGTGSTLAPLGADYSLPALGPVQVIRLTPLQTELRSLAALPNFALSLGETLVNADATVTRIPFVAEIGLTSWLTFGVTVPYVLTRTDIVAEVNPNGPRGNVGINPAVGGAQARATNELLVTQLQQAGTQLSQALDACAANPGGTGCDALNASRDQALALISSANDFAGGISRVYGAAAGDTPAPYVPLVGSEAQTAIEARVAAFRTQYESYGVANVITAAGPVGAQASAALSDLQRVVTDTAFGVAADSLQTVERGYLGDVEVAAKLKLFDTFGGDRRARFAPRGFNARAAVTGVFRAGTGSSDFPNTFLDVGTGDGQNDIEARAALDLFFGRYFWTSLVGRGVFQQSDKQFVRIASVPGEPFPAAYTLRKVDRKLGNYFELEASPRVALSDYFALTGQYMYRRKERDEYTARFSLDSATTGVGPVELDASTLGVGTERTEHRVGGGITYSTLAAFNRHRTPIPFEISYSHFQTVAGTGRTQAKSTIDQLQVRIYARIFGGGR